MWRWSPRPLPRQPEKREFAEEVEVELGKMDNGSDAPPRKTTIAVTGFGDIQRASQRAYADVPIELELGIGGINALALLSAERNGIRGQTEPKGSFVLYNRRALRLETTKSGESFSNLVRSRKVAVLEVIAEPIEEVHDGLPDSNKS